MPELPKTANNLGPAEEFFDFLSILQALFVGVMPSRATVNRCPFLFAGNMRSNLEFTHVADKVSSIISFVSSHSNTFIPVPLLAFYHFVGGHALGKSISLGYLDLSDKAIVVFAHSMTHDR